MTPMPEPAGSEAEPLLLRETNVLARIHLEIQGQGIRRIRLNHFLHKLYVDGVLAEDGVFVHRLKIDCNKEWPRHFRINPLAAFDAQNLGNFQELHPRVHHHPLHAGGSNLGLEFVENDMVNHEG